MTQTPTFNYSRISSIDLLRGIVMVLMALDHTRDYFSAEAFLFEPTDLTQTYPALFLTRFITHYCAPVFIFLAGTSAFLVGQRRGKRSLAIWLLKRGFWLVIVEITIIKLAWFFKLDYSWVALQVIWVLGIGMICLAGFIYVPKYLMIVISLLIVVGHNLFDNYHASSSFHEIWTFLHVFDTIFLGDLMVVVAYPIIPWIFVMALGYHFGQLYTGTISTEQRIKWLKQTGTGLIVFFVILRATNFYGEANLWSQQDSVIFTILSFLNVSKYPPSLLYLLVTLGPALLLLAYSEKWKGKLHDALVIIGRVPMFYYIIHIYLIHSLAMIAAVLTGYKASEMVFDTWLSESPELSGYGFDLWVVYVVWILVVIMLYPICSLYYKYKKNNRDKWWLSYL